MSPGLVILYALVTFAILLLFMKWVLDRTWKSAGRTFERRHRLTYAIMQSRKIPRNWLKRYTKRAAVLDRQSVGDTSRSTAISRKRVQSGKQAKKLAIRKLSALIVSYERGGSFETLQAKKIFMYEIQMVRQIWKDTPVEDIEEIITSEESRDPFTPHST